MTLALLDAPTGLAGNMLLAALLDLGLPEAEIHRPLAALGLAEAYQLELEERRSGGLRGLHLAVVSLEPQARLTDDGILILPHGEFVERLWAGDLF
jgi:uncharacterized protein (DUF111 family)